MNHGTFSEPLYAFVPSLGISQLISIGGKRFPMWAGDLLVGSLRRQSLYRLRVRNDRLTYVETIFAGERIRDLVEGADGRILIWTDAGGVLSVSSAPTTLDGRYIFEARCAGCHEPPHGETNAVAPSLRGVVGRAVAGDRTFEYSEALRQLSGKWTGDRLDRFLRTLVPTHRARMTIGLSDENQRGADRLRRTTGPRKGSRAMRPTAPGDLGNLCAQDPSRNVARPLATPSSGGRGTTSPGAIPIRRFTKRRQSRDPALAMKLAGAGPHARPDLLLQPLNIVRTGCAARRLPFFVCGLPRSGNHAGCPGAG
jgi:cytochrome c2